MTSQLLDGIRVLDFTQFQQGPSATVLMSDLGAEVIKVERLNVGDPSRHVGQREDGFSQYFHTHHRGKRSIAIDLRAPEGRDLVYELVTRVDVVTENFKPGVMNRLGLGWDDLKQRNPKLVYASASGFGPRGPRANATSWASVAGAAGGGMWPNGVRGDNGDKPNPNVAAPDPDQTGGMIFAFAIASGLVARERTGEGQLVQTSLYGSQIWGRAPAINAIANGNIVPSARNMPISNMFTLQAQGSDADWLFVGYITDRWAPMCRALDREDLVTDPRFATVADRNANIDDLRREVASTICTRPTAEWPARFDDEAGTQHPNPGLPHDRRGRAGRRQRVHRPVRGRALRNPHNGRFASESKRSPGPSQMSRPRTRPGHRSAAAGDWLHTGSNRAAPRGRSRRLGML